MAAALLGAWAGAARGDLIDQSYVPVTGEGYNTGSSVNLPLGQEFTPTLGSLDFVDLYLGDAGSDIGPGTSFKINIRQGSIGGTILGTSGTVAVPDNLNLGVGDYADFIVTRFTFATPVALAPGTLDVIEVVQLPPISPPNDNFLAYGGPVGGSTYAGGRGIVGGVPQEGFDFAFVEGVRAVPEPSSLALAGVFVAMGGARAWRRRRASRSPERVG